MRSLTFNFLKLLIKFQFPTVKEINCNQLAQLLLDSAKPRPLVLDARSQTEYAVSHLETAVRIDPLTEDLTAVTTVSQNRPIVVYCAVGYRSAKLAQKLDKAGIKCIYNLSGGIFQWANQGRPIFQNGHPTKVVHPYNAIWGKLLKATYHAHEC
ncbi:MAG: rhodanese-like domain-containing protein [Nostoc sp. EfeVER01]|uniref:rhodanese-like domain-containing protein n=1 Tax=unclassified Nostoc TaxID=2593658 RepID=UPI002AD4E514|nr:MULTISPECIES: rhodanese-like domain-containing protein [unclassified Nostoc]MDZ7943876.1 rhodanese-like domain-containing protein [Nostoc sp. EfeVER01]MDZ7992231.1 rhodanese-like domain-containing protein [Nostoc sp. EspVER01]